MEIERKVQLEASPERVWALLTEPGPLSDWLGLRVTLDLRPGGFGEARRSDGAARRIRIEAFDPPRRLAFRWWPFEEDGRPRAGEGSRVEFHLEPTGTGTTLTVREIALPSRSPLVGAVTP